MKKNLFLFVFVIVCCLACVIQVSTAPARNRTRPSRTTRTTTKLTTSASPCANITCYNDGVCVAFGEQWTCACKQGFVGENCQTNYTEFLAQLATTEPMPTDEPSPCDGITCPGGSTFLSSLTYLLY